MRKIEDYLHLYRGVKVVHEQYPEKQMTVHFTSKEGSVIMGRSDEFEKLREPHKLVLRPLSSMTDAERQECGNMVYDFSDDPELNNHRWQDFEIGLAPEQFHWLLSRHFDLFGLIESGLAIDQTTTTNHAAAL